MREFYSKKKFDVLSSFLATISDENLTKVKCYMASFLKVSLNQRLKQVPQLFRLGNNRLDENKEKNQFQNKTITLYEAENLDKCHWPQNVDGYYAQKFLSPLIKRGVSTYIENVNTRLCALVCDQLVLPITINDAEYENSYVCSPYSYYISYAKESMDLLTQSWFRHMINTLLWGASKILFRYQINKVVVVNNWFYSTNLYPQLKPEHLSAIAQFLRHCFPDYAIVFRSIDSQTNPLCYQVLQQIGFDYIANRQIFFINPRDSTLFETRLFKSDLKLLKNSGYEIVNGDQLKESDLSRMLDLYKDLYINKYSDLNPQFNEDFLHLMWTEKLMHFKALKKEGRIDGVVGYVQRNGMMQSPFFGYDRLLPKENALYRLLSTVLMLEAYDKNLLFHLSSGASMFKKIRKAHSCIEYMAIYHSHLSLKRRLPWNILKKMCNSIGIKYMERY
jgi:hypothetical protein